MVKFFIDPETFQVEFPEYSSITFSEDNIVSSGTNDSDVETEAHS